MQVEELKAAESPKPRNLDCQDEWRGDAAEAEGGMMIRVPIMMTH